MSERKVWQENEDRILIELYEKIGIKKWSQISMMMEQNYGIEGRTGKHCRERYHNHLKKGINKEKWTQEEQARLIELHGLYGNRWALISSLMKGRSQNCAKNMLYAILRKSIRLLNSFSQSLSRRRHKEIKIDFIYKLIEFTEKTYSKDPLCFSEQETQGLKIKNDIFNIFLFANDDISQGSKQKIKDLLQEIYTFKQENRCFKSKSSKSSQPKNNKKMAEVKQKTTTSSQPANTNEYSREKEEQIEQPLSSMSRTVNKRFQIGNNSAELEVTEEDASKSKEKLAKDVQGYPFQHYPIPFPRNYLRNSIQEEYSYSELIQMPEMGSENYYLDFNSSIKWGFDEASQ